MVRKWAPKNAAHFFQKPTKKGVKSQKIEKKVPIFKKWAKMGASKKKRSIPFFSFFFSCPSSSLAYLAKRLTMLLLANIPLIDLAKSLRTKNLTKRRVILFLAKIWHTTALGSSHYNLFRTILPSFYIYSNKFNFQVPQRPGFNVSSNNFFFQIPLWISCLL